MYGTIASFFRVKMYCRMSLQSANIYQLKKSNVKNNFEIKLRYMFYIYQLKKSNVNNNFEIKLRYMFYLYI